MPQTLDGVVLLGWMEKCDAIAYLREHCWFDPQISESDAEALWKKYRVAVETLPTNRQVQPPKRLPIPASEKAWVNQFLARYRGPEVLDVINIDPRGLAIYQFYVAVSRSDHHAKNMSNGWAQTCLQIDRPTSQLPIRIENNTFKVSLPHGEHMLGLQPDGAFRIQQGDGYVCVCEIQGRMVLKAGYHRSFAFVRAVTKAPDAKDTSLLVALTATAPAQLSPQFPATQGLRTTVLGSRPPLFSDFLDDSLAIKVKLRRKKFEAHIRFEQVDDP